MTHDGSITSFTVNYGFINQRRIATGYSFEYEKWKEPFHNQEALKQAIIDVEQAINDGTDYVFPETA